MRAATLDDLDALDALEHRCFDGDRLSRPSFRHMLTRANASLLIAGPRGRPHGYVLVLFRAGAGVARLYSIAVAPETRGGGLGRKLMAAAESAARGHGCAVLRLEVRRDNGAALGLYHALGYHGTGARERYYEDGMDAVLMEKPLEDG